MFIITQEQDYILTVLQKTRFMRKSHAVRLLKTINGERDADYTDRCLGQLVHIRKITWKTADIFALPHLYNEPTDEDMLSAIDIMLDLSDARILALSVSPPYKLCFYTGDETNLGSYAVIIVTPGAEAVVTASLCGAEPDGRTVIFLLSELSQKEGVKTATPHFFAIHDGGKYRYFKGVSAMPH